MFKEFFTDLCKEVFDTDRGLWLANKKNELYPNPHAYATERTYSFPHFECYESYVVRENDVELTRDSNRSA